MKIVLASASPRRDLLLLEAGVPFVIDAPHVDESVDGAPELTAEASKAIDKGLSYLLSVQHDDGSWDSDGKGGHAVAITSLSLMAFMSKAHFPGFGPYGGQLDRGMKVGFLISPSVSGEVPAAMALVSASTSASAE
mgnify:CR=1 FL=1